MAHLRARHLSRPGRVRSRLRSQAGVSCCREVASGGGLGCIVDGEDAEPSATDKGCFFLLSPGSNDDLE